MEWRLLCVMVTTDVLYVSTVDNPHDPKIFVTYHDAQAYPEYLVQFRKN